MCNQSLYKKKKVKGKDVRNKPATNSQASLELEIVDEI